MENRGRQRERGKSPGNHGKSRKGRSKSRLGKIECWNCGKKGHLKKDLLISKETRRWTTREKSGRKCSR
jgi:hypothetical protein